MTGLFTDAGRGGTREGLAVELNVSGRTCALAMFLVTMFCLHVMNRMMK